MEKGWVGQGANGLYLTPDGRKQFKVIFTGGVYDLIHRGHIETLNEAKSLGDLLVVVIARDETAKRWKRAPINHEEDRRIIVENLKPVDIAVLGNKEDHLKTIEWIKPDVIAIGADQHYDIEKLQKQLEGRGMKNIAIQRLKSDVEGLSTTSLINRILARYRTKEIEEVRKIEHSEGKQS
ncbi:MAG: FAD synthase [Methanobacteriota archaeon]|nr:MAG: FAD synthase [Euryarchaeota archaeon]